MTYLVENERLAPYTRPDFLLMRQMRSYTLGSSELWEGDIVETGSKSQRHVVRGDGLLEDFIGTAIQLCPTQQYEVVSNICLDTDWHVLT